ncbi:hypothetical protein LTS17_008777 [Exophiala oligosperma]
MPVYVGTAIIRARRPSSVQARTLWWWSRHSSEPQHSYGDNFEERVARHHKMLRSRYSKAFARRVLREKKVNLHWFGRGNHRFWDNRYCAYQPPTTDPAKDSKSEKQSHEGREGESENPEDVSFESFRARIDRAIAEDPHGCLFGRPSHVRQTPRHSSFDPFSWESRSNFETNDKINAPETTRARVANTDSVADSPASSSNPETRSPFAAKSDTPCSEKNAQAMETKSEMEDTSPSRHEKASLVDVFFSEHGVEIPVKTYKSHKVYGYGTSEPSLDGSKSDEIKDCGTKSLESSRKQNLRELMFRTKGNSLDTSAQFTEMTDIQALEEAGDRGLPNNRKRESPAPDDSTPLFSGTTYEAKSAIHINASAKKDDWLAKEGFRTHGLYGNDEKAREPLETPTKGYVGFRKQTEKDHVAVEEVLSHPPGETTNPILEPALDRIQAAPGPEPGNDVRLLETSLDRHLKQDGTLKSDITSPPTDKIFRDSIPSTEEDMDLLRASDVRAATRTSRHTKQEVENRKKATRKEMEHTWTTLEDDFKDRRDDATTTKPETAWTPANHSLDDVRSHIRGYVDGIMAKTKQSMGALNSNYDSYVRLVGRSKWADLTKKLVFKDEALSKTPSIFTAKPQNPSKSSTPDPEVAEAVEERDGRTTSLREATARARREWEKTETQLSKLSNNIRAIYEDEYGSINVDHRQPSPSEDLGQTIASRSSDPARATYLPPLLNATVKPGVVTDPVVDAHVNTFEPKYAELVDAAKAVRRELHEAKMALRAIESGRPSHVWTVPSSADFNFGKKRITFKAQVVGASEPEIPAPGDDPMTKPDGKVIRVDAASTRGKDETVPEPVFTESGSPEWNDEQIPPIESLRTRESDAPYLSLVYDHSTGKVIVSPVNEPSHMPNKRADLVEVLGRLKHAPEFLKHFTTLKQAEYSLVDGGEDMLVFVKKSTRHVPPKPLSDTNAGSDKPASTKADRHAATVLDEIPAEIETPGPAAPTAPTPSSPKANTRAKVKRQEDVFSGTLRPGEEAAPRNDEAGYEEDSLGRRFTRRLRVICLTVASLGAGAYIIGFVAEGLGAQAQRQNGVAEDGQVSGPRKRIVMTGQRPGIFSTESSR